MTPAMTHPVAPIALPLEALQSASEMLEQTTGTTGAPAGDPTAPGGEQGPASPSGAGNLWMIFAIVGVIWFLIFMPERKAKKQREEMLGALKKGDKVVTTGGLHAQVAELRENEVVLKAGDVRLTFSRASIHQVEGQDES